MNAEIERATGRRVLSARRVGGGCINDGLRVELEDGAIAFVKTRADVPPDERATEAAARRGTALAGAARRFDPATDFERFDLIVAMDSENRRDLLALAPDDAARRKVRMLRAGDLDVPDPYYGGEDGFERVLDLVEEAARQLLDEIR